MLYAKTTVGVEIGCCKRSLRDPRVSLVTNHVGGVVESSLRSWIARWGRPYVQGNFNCCTSKLLETRIRWQLVKRCLCDDEELHIGKVRISPIDHPFLPGPATRVSCGGGKRTV